jgi:Holliday junction resolvase-like predicted endonuclease
MLERYFKRVLMESKAYTRIGSWWNRKGENEIDIVAENELNDEAVFIEVKHKEENFDADALYKKIDAFTRATGKFKDYTVSQKGLSMTDM